jgi:hypothetical protein
LLRSHRHGRLSISHAGAYLAFLPIFCGFPTVSATADALYPRSPGGSGTPGQSTIGDAQPASDHGSGDAGVGSAGHTADRLAELDRELAEIDALLATAHFHTVLALVIQPRGQLDTLGPDTGLVARRVRLEVMAATAEIALGRRSQARRSLQRALGADSRLSLDEQATSPKVLSLLRELRRGNGPRVNR